MADSDTEKAADWGKACCVTGHRDLEKAQETFIRAELCRSIEEAVRDGYTYFLSGFAAGTDLLFAEEVLRRQNEGGNLFLVAYLPSAERLNSRDPLFCSLLRGCRAVRVISEVYEKGCELKRDRAMVDPCRRVIAVYDGRERGGTAYTIRYAQKQEKELRIIRLRCPPFFDV